MKKRGQLSIFLIIGIVILLFGSYAIYLAKQANISKQFTNIDFVEKSISFEMDSCLKRNIEEALKKTALQGRINTNNYLTYQGNKVYYAFDKKPTLVTIEVLENEISQFIGNNIEDCADVLYEDLSKNNVMIERKVPAVDVLIAEDAINIRLDYPIWINVGQDKVKLDSSYNTVSYRLHKLYKISEKIVQEFDKTSGLINMTYLNSEDVLSTVIPFADGTILFILEDAHSELDGKSAAYSFAVRN